MTYTIPSYIDASLSEYPIDYDWDDMNVESKMDFDYAQNIMNQLPPITLRGKYLLLSGIYDWVLARLNHRSFDAVFYQIAEAAYCANINKCLFNLELELPRNDYRGPVNGVLWCSGYSSLLANYYLSALDSDLAENELYEPFFLSAPDDNLLFLIALVRHMLPKEKLALFDRWLNGVISRLSTFCALADEDELEHLFGYENDIDWLGPYVAKEILDLDKEYHPDQAFALCDNYLRQVNFKNNPLLLSPDALPEYVEFPFQLTERE